MSSKSDILSVGRKLDVLNPVRLFSRFCFSEYRLNLSSLRLKFCIKKVKFSSIISSNNQISLMWLPINSSDFLFQFNSIFFLVGFGIKDSQCVIITSRNKLFSVWRPGLTPKFTCAMRTHNNF